ncbi:hypothetical protein J3D54_005021 [Pseudomonas sp. GGS8]|uniref:hypothetical protein n=1 Tax=Pseudomonas sp. GGS8 TaxID=2817892 RepID=UPI00209F4A21|nr:hypothetical protein [Pseudomonas sp. GGS8]MCP1445889.1 hypothetical protein [Pseudomonas sp. GGS8]
MTYREAIDQAIKAWDSIRWHINKSEQSKSAVHVLRLLLKTPGDDKLLRQAIDTFLGTCHEAFNYAGVNYVQLKPTSALYANLDKYIKGANPPLISLPVVASSSSPRPGIPPVAITSALPSVGLSVASSSSSSPAVSSSSPASASSRDTSALLVQISRHQAEWSKIAITDLPTGKHGVYKYTDDNKYADVPRGAVSGLLKREPKIDEQGLRAPEFWALFGAIVMRAPKKFGRCLHCSAAVVHSLVFDPFFDNCEIAVMGSTEYDHYFVCVGSSMGKIRTGLGIAIDVWDSNNPAKPSSTSTHPLAKNFTYWSEAGLEILCPIPTESRAALRLFVKSRFPDRA